MKNEKKLVLNVTGIPADLLKAAKAQAKKEDRPLSQVIRDLLRAWLQVKNG
jgi:hypothetical protein